MLLQFDEMIRESGEAVCLSFDGKKIWIPKTVSTEPDLNTRRVEVQGWFARSRGLEVYSVD